MAPDISSPSNERIKWLLRLRDRRHRDEEGVFVVEGERLYRRALAAGLVPSVTFVSDASTVTVGQTLTVDPLAMDRAAYRSRSQGLIAVFPQLETALGSIGLPDEPLVLIAEGIEKPGNLGAMLRTAGAVGVDALVTVGVEPDPHNPNVSRASTGALFDVPLAVSQWDELEPWLQAGAVRVVGASPETSVPMWETDLTGALALVVGAEDMGLSTRARQVADETVMIPQRPGSVDSLNVSVAAGILLYEALRQRRGP